MWRQSNPLVAEVFFPKKFRGFAWNCFTYGKRASLCCFLGLALFRVFTSSKLSFYTCVAVKRNPLEPATRAICKTWFSCRMNVGKLKSFIFPRTVMFVWIIIIQALQSAQIFTISITVKYWPLFVKIMTAFCENQYGSIYFVNISMLSNLILCFL